MSKAEAGPGGVGAVGRAPMRRVLVANRGEIACRVIRSCRALGFETVAVHSEADATSMHVAEAHASEAIGGASPAESYLRADAVIAAARRAGADAVHPGYGFLAENAGFAHDVEAAGLTWVGPTPKSIEDMGDKERARLLAKAAGVPVLPGSARFAPGDNAGLADAAVEVGFPLLVKAAAGGGGIGMRRVDSPEGLAASVEATQSMAQRAFGDGTVYLERFIAQARHVEVQVFGFGDGRAIHVHERDCSVQRRFQKIIEESPAPGISADTRARMYAAAVSLCHQERYRGAGTIEFVLDAETESFYFLEMNTRIQVEHPVSEMVTGLDLIAMQLLLAAGRPLPVSTQADVSSRGHAIECRLYAERPAKGFLPSTGVLDRFELPALDASLRIDSGVRQGDRITHFYDPMIAKLIAHGADRAAAIERMLDALGQVHVEGVETNLAFLRRAIAHPAFRAGGVTTSYVDAHKAQLLG
ncbi:MAG: acetyl/propionyl/methylcrotonyl-CoA carboxylase subunit alpha [Lautropia sp.]